MIYQHDDFSIEIDLKIRTIQSFSLQEGVNRHTIVSLSGVAQETEKETVSTLKNDTVKIRDRNGEMVFTGMIILMEIKETNQLFQFQLKAGSLSYQLDRKKRRRIFQDLDMTYETIINEVLSNYEKASYLDKVSQGKKIPHIMVQFDETDWEFLKRMASHFNEGICVSSQSDSIQLYFGLPKDDIQEICGEQEMRKINLMDLQEAIRIKLQSRYPAGHTVKYGRNLYFIKESELLMERGELLCHGLLERSRETAFPYQPNVHIAGARIPAYAGEIKCNQMRLQFKIADPCKGNNPFFPYAGEVNNEAGFYMPEPGNEIEVYFPNEKEENAIVTSARRTTKNAPSKAGSSMKYMRNKEGNELYMDAEKLRFATGGAGAAIQIGTDGTISISAPETVKIENGGDLELGGFSGTLTMHAEHNICIQAGSSKGKIVFDESGNITCKALQNVLYKRNDSGQAETSAPAVSQNKKEVKSAAGIRDAVLALSGVEFIAQAVTENPDFQPAQKLVNHIIGLGDTVETNTEHSEGNLIKEKLLQNDERLFCSFSYGENKNGG